MATVIFSLNGVDLKIQCLINETMKEIINRFNNKSEKDKIDINKDQLLYNGKLINLDLTFFQLANRSDKERKVIHILVYNSDNKKSTNEGIIKSKEIICPKCKENCLISFEQDKIKLYDCKNGHSMDNISLKEFNNLQNINENEIKCDNANCTNSKYKSYNKQFYKCLNCKINLCPLCNQNHNKTHEIIDYNNIHYICFEHKDFYISYCKYCKINLCMKCEIKHNANHIIINYKNILPNDDEIKKKLNGYRNKIEKLKQNIIELINILNEVYKRIEIFYKINYDILFNYNFKQRNYEILKNVNSIKDFINSSDIDNIINIINNDKCKFEKIYNISNKNNINNIKEKQMEITFMWHGGRILIGAGEDDLFAEIAFRFLNMIGINSDYGDYKFFYNSYQLKPESAKSLREHRLRNGSVIEVLYPSLVIG